MSISTKQSKGQNRLNVTQGGDVQNRNESKSRLYRELPDVQLSGVFTARANHEIRANRDTIKFHAITKSNDRASQARDRPITNTQISKANETERNKEGNQHGQECKDGENKSQPDVHSDYNDWVNRDTNRDRNNCDDWLVHRDKEKCGKNSKSMDSQPTECPSSSARANSNEPGKSKLGQPEGFGRAGLTGGDHETTRNPLVKSRENPVLEATREQPA